MARKRDYAAESAKYNTPERKAYRAMLNREARRLGIYGLRREQGIEFDVQNGKIVGFATTHENRVKGAQIAGSMTRAKCLHKTRMRGLAAPKVRTIGKGPNPDK